MNSEEYKICKANFDVGASIARPHFEGMTKKTKSIDFVNKIKYNEYTNIDKLIYQIN
ncbi:MAG: hypothetical protein IJB90_04215 [Clostridia bacterium]|nr:hypothetical protein [Clostridia bacterium]